MRVNVEGPLFCFSGSAEAGNDVWEGYRRGRVRWEDKEREFLNRENVLVRMWMAGKGRESMIKTVLLCI